MNTIPYEFQVKGARLIRKYGGRALLSDDMGLGKSLTTLLYLQRNPSVRPVVIVCPASMKWGWQRELQTHMNWHGEVLEGLSADREWIYRPEFLIVNYDILAPRDGSSGWVDKLRSIKPKCVVLDECHAIQNRSAKRTKAVKELCRGVPHVLALSGTPMTNKPAELYPVLNILRPDVFSNWHSYAWDYCGPKRKPWGMEYKGATNLKELNEKLQGIMIRRLKRDVLTQLPSKSTHILPLPLSDRKQYQQATNEFLIWLAQHRPDKLTSAARAERLAKVNYLKQLSGELKLPAIMEWIDNFLETGAKLVVFACYRKTLAQLRKRYSKVCTVIEGETSTNARKQAVEDFQNKPACRLFLGNIRAAGSGLTLTRSSTVLFTELDWTPGAHAQASDRVNRIGQTEPCSIYYSVGVGTIEEKLIKLLIKKQNVLDATLDGGVSESTQVFEELISELYGECK